MSQHHSEAFLAKIRRVGRMINLLAKVSPALAGRAAFRLFCTPRKQGLREEDRRFLDTARQETLTLENIAIRTYTWQPAATAQGRSVVFLHGWESNSGRWKKYIRELVSAGFTVRAFDAPGHGLSGGQFINLPLFSRVLTAFMKETETPYALIGHSLGGAAVVMSMAAFGAPRVQKAVVMGSFAESARVLRDFGALLGLDECVVAAVNREIIRQSGISIEAYSVEGKAALLTDVRGLVIHDRDDDVAPLEEGKAIAKAWRARLIETEGLGHRMQSQVVAEVVREFLEEA
ncbi:MAG: alpha/beta fold hydrolase [Saprospiraceae bacterium]